jgi:hypothetical protein
MLTLIHLARILHSWLKIVCITSGAPSDCGLGLIGIWVRWGLGILLGLIWDLVAAVHALRCLGYQCRIFL